LFKLSIVIPTYNRSNLLEYTLEAIINQCSSNSLKNSIEIIVSDNDSTDNTKEVVEKIDQKFRWGIQYFKNEENIGDLNFIYSLSKAKGEFIWLFADDDLLEGGAIVNILNNLNSKTDLYILNYSIWDDSFCNIIRQFRYPFVSNFTLQKRDKVLSKFGIGLQFISANIFSRRLYERLNLQKCMLLKNDNNMHLYMIYSGLNVDCQVQFFAKTLLKYRGNLSSPPKPEVWNRIFVHSNFKLFMYLYREGYSIYSIYLATDKIIKTYLISNIVSSRVSGYGRIRTISNMPYMIYFHPRFILFCIPLLLIPSNLLIILKSIFNRLRTSRNSYY
jgi:glycosyltransferase involved in cell wall biosynthesis